MMTRTIRKSLLRLCKPPSHRPLTISTAPPPPPPPPPPKNFIKVSTVPGSSPSHPRDIAKAKPQDRARILPSFEELRTQTFQPAPTPQLSPITHPIDPSVHELLPLLKSQPPFYTRIHIHGKPYLVTVGDKIRLPFYMHNVNLGDVLRLSKATLVGSRDYTLKSGSSVKGEEQKYLDGSLFVCRARVTGHTQEPLRVKLKTKRRRRHVKRTLSKHRYTVLTVTELSICDTPSE